MQFLPDEKIVLKTTKFISIGGDTMMFPYRKGGKVFKLGFSGVSVFLTNRRIYTEWIFFMKKALLDLPIKDVKDFRIENLRFISLVRITYKEKDEEKEVVFNFWKKDAEKWNEALKKLLLHRDQ